MTGYGNFTLTIVTVQKDGKYLSQSVNWTVSGRGRPNYIPISDGESYEQKDTTDGKVNVEETAMDRTSAGENENETPVEAETVEKADDVSAKTEKNTAFENQKNHAEQKTLADVAPVATQKVAAEQNSSETIIDAKSVLEDNVASSEAILPLGSDEIVPAGQEGVQFAAAAESPEKPVAENRIAQAEKTSTPQQIHEEVVSNC